VREEDDLNAGSNLAHTPMLRNGMGGTDSLRNVRKWAHLVSNQGKVPASRVTTCCLAGWHVWLGACLGACFPLMSLRENLIAWALLGSAVCAVRVRAGRGSE